MHKYPPQQNEPVDGEKEFVFCATYRLTCESDSAILEAQSAAIKNAFKAEGVTTDSIGFLLTGKDSASVSAVLKQKMKRIESDLQNAAIEVNAELMVFGAEKQYFYADNDKEHPIIRWYLSAIGTPQNEEYSDWEGVKMPTGHYKFCDGFLTKDEYFVAELQGKLDNWNTVHHGHINYDLNSYAGKQLYLYLHFSSNTNWDTRDAKYTDVIAMYAKKSSEEPTSKSITINGRTYYRVKDAYDLNKGAGGDWIWLYATTDYYDGYYLFVNNCKAAFSEYDWAWERFKNFDPWQYANRSYTIGTHRCVDRVVQRYTPKGVHEGNAEVNCCAGGNHIYLIFSYATK